MIIRYHLTTGTTLDEEVPFGASEEDVLRALAETLLEHDPSANKAHIHRAIPVVTSRITTKPGGGRPIRTMIFTANITHVELILSELDEKREAGAEGKN